MRERNLRAHPVLRARWERVDAYLDVTRWYARRCGERSEPVDATIRMQQRARMRGLEWSAHRALYGVYA